MVIDLTQKTFNSIYYHHYHPEIFSKEEKEEKIGPFEGF